MHRTKIHGQSKNIRKTQKHKQANRKVKQQQINKQYIRRLKHSIVYLQTNVKQHTKNVAATVETPFYIRFFAFFVASTSPAMVAFNINIKKLTVDMIVNKIAKYCFSGLGNALNARKPNKTVKPK
jgi:hypothetical protein